MMKKVVAQFRLVCKLDIEETPKLLEFLRTGTCSVKEA